VPLVAASGKGSIADGLAHAQFIRRLGELAAASRAATRWTP